MKQVISLFLCVAMLLCVFCGCSLPEKPEVTVPEEKVRAADLVNLHYTLDQEMIDRYYGLLAQAEALAIDGEDLEQAEAVSDQVDDAYMDLVDQYQIAYILYCVDQSDEEMKAQYMDCVDITTEAENAYNEMCKRVWLSETPLRDKLFEDWTQDEIDRMLAYNDEIAQLEKRNEELTVEFRELSDSKKESGMIPLYNEMVRNNNRIAQIYGYNNYYDYGYDVVYQRDYGIEQITLLRQYAAQYLPELCSNAALSFSQTYDQLGTTEQRLISQLVNRTYDGLKKNFVFLYLDSLPETARTHMQNMFDGENAVFATDRNAYQGAFTTFINDKPYCYFSKEYAGSETVVHELGHYYGGCFGEPWSMPMDLAETQSQGNEWLFLHFMETQLSPQAHECLTEYKLNSDLNYILCFVMVDQFEQQVYAHENAGNLSEEEYEEIMDSVAEDYGGMDYVRQELMDVQRYWRHVVLESPVYYASYAVSGIAAINLFTVAQEDVEKAHDIYVKLIEESREDDGFLVSIQHAGLTGPFEETVYLALQARYGETQTEK